MKTVSVGDLVEDDHGNLGMVVGHWDDPRDPRPWMRVKWLKGTLYDLGYTSPISPNVFWDTYRRVETST